MFVCARCRAARHTRCAPLPLVAGQSHVEILDSNRACESAAGFQSCAHDPISIPMLRPFAENWPHAIALPLWGGVGGGGRSWLTPLEQQQRPPSPTLPHKGLRDSWILALGSKHVDLE